MDAQAIRATAEYRRRATFIERVLYLLETLLVGVTLAAEVLCCSRRKVRRNFINHVRGFKDGLCTASRYLTTSEEALLAEAISKMSEKNKCPTVSKVREIVRNPAVSDYCLLTPLIR